MQYVLGGARSSFASYPNLGKKAAEKEHKNPGMLEVYKAMGEAQGNKASVLVQGETETRKELVVRDTYLSGILKDGPYPSRG